MHLRIYLDKRKGQGSDAWGEETGWRKGSLTVFILFAPLQDL